jgi:hypothetical protein
MASYPSTGSPTPAPSGGGGGGGTQQTQQASAPSEQDQLSAELDNIFNPVLSALQGQESTLNQNYAPVEGQITAQADLSKESLANQQASGMRELGTQETAAGGRKEDALSSATRLYNELQRGGQQRFGGASSAGEAYQTLTATEQQRRQGTIQTAYETAMQQVGQYKANLQDKYSTAVKEVELQKSQALADAQAQFRDALQQIKSAQSQVESDKAAASMNVLQDLRNKVYTINQQSLQFAQQLALNNQTNLQTVDAYTQKVLASVTGGSTAVSQFNPQLSTNYGTIGGQQSTGTTQTGQIQSRMGYHWDPTTQQMVPD